MILDTLLLLLFACLGLGVSVLIMVVGMCLIELCAHVRDLRAVVEMADPCLMRGYHLRRAEGPLSAGGWFSCATCGALLRLPPASPSAAPLVSSGGEA